MDEISMGFRAFEAMQEWHRTPEGRKSQLEAEQRRNMEEVIAAGERLINFFVSMIDSYKLPDELPKVWTIGKKPEILELLNKHQEEEEVLRYVRLSDNSIETVKAHLEESIKKAFQGHLPKRVRYSAWVEITHGCEEKTRTVTEYEMGHSYNFEESYPGAPYVNVKIKVWFY